MKTTTNKHAENARKNAIYYLSRSAQWEELSKADNISDPQRTQYKTAAQQDKTTAAEWERKATIEEATTAEHLTQVGQTAAYIAIRARIRFGDGFLLDLQRQQYNDLKREALPQYATISAEAYAEHDRLRLDAEAHAEQAAQAKRHAERTTNKDERAALFEYAAQEATKAANLRREAAEALGYAQDIDKAAEHMSTSDRQDIVNTAIVAYMEAITAADLTDEDSTDAAFYAAIKAAGKAIHAHAAAQGHPHTKTSKAAISADEAATFAATYGTEGKAPYAVRGGMQAGYKTIKQDKHGQWFKVYHYKTYTPKPLDSAQDEADRRTFTIEEAESAASRANLTERERRVIDLISETSKDPAAPAVHAAGIEAVAAYHAETERRKAEADTLSKRRRIERERTRGREANQLPPPDKARTAAMITAAWDAVGVTTKAAQDTATSRMRSKIAKALEAKPEPIDTTAAPAEAAAVLVTIYRTKDSRTEDERKYGREYATMGIKWGKHYPKPQELTEAEKATEAAKEAEQERITAALYRFTKDIDSHEQRTAYAAHDAHAAAAAFLPTMSRDELTAAAIAYTEAKRTEAAPKAASPAAKDSAKAAAMFARIAAWEARQEERRKAAEEAAAAKAAEAERRKEAYNAAIRAAYAKMGKTHRTATEKQRAKARAAALKAAAKA